MWRGLWLGEPFSFLSAHCFSSFHLGFFGVSTSWQPWKGVCALKSTTRFNAIWLMLLSGFDNKSLCTPCVMFSLCQKGHFGNRIGSLVDGRSIAWLEWVRKGVLHGSPWENCLTFKLWHPGHNSLLSGVLHATNFYTNVNSFWGKDFFNI